MMIPLLTLCVLAGTHCSGASSAGGGLTSALPLASIQLSPRTLQLNVGDEQRIDVRGYAASGADVALSGVSWTLPPEVALTATGGEATVRGLRGGRVWIVAHVANLADSALVDITPRLTPRDHVLLDARKALQQAASLAQAWALFPGNDHTGARAARNGAGWSFTTNFDGHGTHALRADWAAVPTADQGIRIISYFSTPKPREVYFEFKAYLGKNPADPAGNGSDNTFPLYPQSNSVKRFLILRDGVGGGANDRLDYVWTRSSPSAARVQIDALNWGVSSSADIWSPNDYLGRPYTTTIYVKASSANGVPNGVYRVWIDGKLVLDATNVVLDAYALDRWQFPDTSHNFPIAASEYFWDFLVWAPEP